MKLRSLTLLLTDDCNFNCQYCYKPKSKKYMESSTIEKGLIFFLPWLTEDFFLNFYGGEPLLAFDLIKKAAALLKNNKDFGERISYSITTNGSLLTKETIRFLEENEFSVELSFDGLAQDVSRKKGSVKRIVPIVEDLLNSSGISLEINSVFSPDSVSLLSESIKFIMDLGVPDIRCSISTTGSWNEVTLSRLEKEMSRLREMAVSHYKKEGNNPIVNFRDLHEQGIFHCAAGQDRMTIAPDEGVWGCYLFADYFRERENSPEYQKYSYGLLDDFMKNHQEIYPRVSSNYSKLSMDNFRTSKIECFLCKEYKNCVVCPINASFSGVPLGKIPVHICTIQKIKRREKEKFRKELERISEQ